MNIKFLASVILSVSGHVSLRGVDVARESDNDVSELDDFEAFVASRINFVPKREELDLAYAAINAEVCKLLGGDDC